MKINKGHYLLNSMTLLFFQLMSPSSETVFRHPFNFAGICINFFALFSRLHNYYRQRGIESNENNLSGRARKILLLKFAIALNEFIFQSPTTRIAWNFIVMRKDLTIFQANHSDLTLQISFHALCKCVINSPDLICLIWVTL